MNGWDGDITFLNHQNHGDSSFDWDDHSLIECVPQTQRADLMDKGPLSDYLCKARTLVMRGIEPSPYRIGSLVFAWVNGLGLLNNQMAWCLL